MFPTQEGAPASSLVRTTLAAAAGVALLFFAAASFLAGSQLDTGSLARLAAAQSDVSDPVTTGSIGRHANATRLDPCVLARP